MPTLLRVLLVDDDEIDRRAILRLAREQRLPYEIDIAATCAEAITRCSEFGFDLILLDYQLGDGTGLEVLSKVKKTPVIFITGRGNEDIAVQAMRNGAYDYLVKDVERNYLKVLPLIVERAMARKNMLEALAEAEQRRVLIETASAAAHEINQPLQVISIWSEAMLSRTGPDHPDRPQAVGVLDAVDRIGEILAKMKEIHRYVTTPYPGGRDIIDFEAASRPESA